MVEKEKVIVCDECKKSIAEITCDICGIDLCSDCRRRETLSFYERIFCKVYLCKKCSKELERITRDLKTFEEFKNFFDKDEAIRSTIINQIKKKLILERLDKNG